MYCKMQYIFSVVVWLCFPRYRIGMGRASSLKTAVLTLRIAPRIKVAAEEAAEKDHRSVTNLIEVLLIDHCRRIGISVGTATDPRAKK